MAARVCGGFELGETRGRRRRMRRRCLTAAEHIGGSGSNLVLDLCIFNRFISCSWQHNFTVIIKPMYILYIKILLAIKRRISKVNDKWLKICANAQSGGFRNNALFKENTVKDIGRRNCQRCFGHVTTPAGGSIRGFLIHVIKKTFSSLLIVAFCR